MELINIDEANYDYGNDCLLCHDPNKAPEFVYASFTNILRGDDWVPADGTPPNTTFKLSQNLQCQWDATVGPWYISFTSGGNRTIVGVSKAGPPIAFEHISAPDCQIAMSNIRVNPVGEHFYGGEVAITWVEPPSDFSLDKLCEDLNIPTDGLTDCLIYPVPPTSQVVNMLRGVDQIKILIKRDFP